MYDDPVPQALVLTAIVIGFATTALFLVVLLALRGLSGTDHVDGREHGPMNLLLQHLIVSAHRRAARRGRRRCCSWPSPPNCARDAGLVSVLLQLCVAVAAALSHRAMPPLSSGPRA